MNGYDEDSIFYSYLGREAFDQAANLRLNFDWSNNAWSFNADYQIYAEYGELTEARHKLTDVAWTTGEKHRMIED